MTRATHTVIVLAILAAFVFASWVIIWLAYPVHCERLTILAVDPSGELVTHSAILCMRGP